MIGRVFIAAFTTYMLFVHYPHRDVDGAADVVKAPESVKQDVPAQNIAPPNQSAAASQEGKTTLTGAIYSIDKAKSFCVRNPKLCQQGLDMAMNAGLIKK